MEKGQSRMDKYFELEEIKNNDVINKVKTKFFLEQKEIKNCINL